MTVHCKTFLLALNFTILGLNLFHCTVYWFVILKSKLHNGKKMVKINLPGPASV